MFRDVVKDDIDKVDDKFKVLIENSFKGYEIMFCLYLVVNLVVKG